MEQDEKNKEQFRCPRCYLVWYGIDLIPELQGNDRRCSFCSEKRTEEETLIRQLDICDEVKIKDFGNILRNMYKHLNNIKVELNLDLEPYADYKCYYHAWNIEPGIVEKLNEYHTYIIEDKEYRYLGPPGCMGAVDYMHNGYLFVNIKQAEQLYGVKCC